MSADAFGAGGANRAHDLLGPSDPDPPVVVRWGDAVIGVLSLVIPLVAIVGGTGWCIALRPAAVQGFGPKARAMDCVFDRYTRGAEYAARVVDDTLAVSPIRSDRSFVSRMTGRLIEAPGVETGAGQCSAAAPIPEPA